MVSRRMARVRASPPIYHVKSMGHVRTFVSTACPGPEPRLPRDRTEYMMQHRIITAGPGTVFFLEPCRTFDTLYKWPVRNPAVF